MTVSAPLNLLPANGASLATNNPLFDCDSGDISSNLSKRLFEIASDAGFTTNLQVLDEGVYRYSHSAASSVTLTSMGGTPVSAGTWYVRARFQEQTGGAYSDYSTTSTVTIAHQPSVLQASLQGNTSYVYSATPTLNWTFQDPYGGDVQTKYEWEFWKDADYAGSVISSGEVTSAAATDNVATLDATWKDVLLRWSIRVADVDGTWSTLVTSPAFYLRDAPAIAMVDPVDTGNVTNSQPTLDWSFSASDGRTQYSYELLVVDQSGDTGNIADTGVVVSATSQYTIPTPVVAQGYTYSLTLKVTDSSGLSTTINTTFDATLSDPTPANVVIDGSAFESQGVVYLSWAAATVDAGNLGWRVYRRESVNGNWELLMEVDTVTEYAADYTCPSNLTVQYAVVQIVDSFGETVESPYVPKNFSGQNPHYMLIVPDDPTNYNTVLWMVTADSFGDEQEMLPVNLIGRGRRVEYGTRFGKVGSLVADFRDNASATAREQRVAVEAVRDSGLRVLLRNPFGDVWEVALNSAQITRTAGVGLREHAIATIEYTEITA